MSEYIRSNFTLRRTAALVVCLICFGLCTAAVVGWVQLQLVPAVIILIVGLLAYEWAG